MVTVSGGFSPVFQQKLISGTLNRQQTVSPLFQKQPVTDRVQLRFGGTASHKANEIMIPLSSNPQDKTIVRDPRLIIAKLAFQKDNVTGGMILCDESQPSDDSLQVLSSHQVSRVPSRLVIFRGDKIRWRGYQFILLRKPGQLFCLKQIPGNVSDKDLQRVTNINWIGRAMDNHINLDSGNISGHHAVILEFERNTWPCLMDLKSSNGTYYDNGQKLEPFFYLELSEGRRITLDGTTYQVFKKPDGRLELVNQKNHKRLWIEGQ